MKKNYPMLSPLATLFILPLALLVACASSEPKADLPANANPNEEVTKLHQDIANGQTQDFAVLDPKDFDQSQEHLANAEGKLRNGKSQEDVLEEVRVSRGYYNRTESVSNERRGHVQPILDARANAVSSGALQYPQSHSELTAVDQDARRVAESSDIPTAEKVNELQKRYGEVQLDALVAQNLGSVKATLEAANEQDAKSIAPKTFNQAQVDYENAKNAISMNRSDRGQYAAPVKQAILSGDTLARVMEMAKKNKKNFNEDEAVRIVQQDRRIHSLDNQVTTDQAQTSALEAQKTSLNDTLSNQQKDLNLAKQKVAMQKALQSAQDEFTPAEAEVYQQDNKLLIRLKSIGFASGSATIPDNSNALLDKVQTIVEGLKPSAVVVEGNTDSVGGKTTNEKLSQKRAEEVATYFEKKGLDANIVKTAGYGDEKPLATNKTKEGRAQNRRIDILVTPSEAI